MRRLATLAVVVVAALLGPTTASGQDYTFGDWARDQGYSPGDAMPEYVRANSSSPAIDNLDGIGEFDWTTTPTTTLYLYDNQISSIESGDFNGLTNLTTLRLNGNELSSIESGDFSELTNLDMLNLQDNQLSSIESDDFSGLANLTELRLWGNQISSIESGDFGGLTNLTNLILSNNRLTSIESDDFSGLPKLAVLRFGRNQISSIESGVFSGLTDLEELRLRDNAALTELDLAEAAFSNLTLFDVSGNVGIVSVSLRNTLVNQTSLTALLYGSSRFEWPIGIGELDGITEMDLSGIGFGNITDLEPIYAMDDLTDLWLVDTVELDVTNLDVLLDNLETIERADTEGTLYMTQADFDAFNTAGGGLLAAWDAEPGHHVEFVPEPLLGDMSLDGEVDGRDVDAFVVAVLSESFPRRADMNGDDVVNGLDVDPFVAAVVGSGAQSIPEPSTLLLCIIALGVVGGWRKWGG